MPQRRTTVVPDFKARAFRPAQHLVALELREEMHNEPHAGMIECRAPDIFILSFPVVPNNR